jgi:hypothetical protein
LEQEQIREYGRLQHDVTTKLRQHAFIDDMDAWHVFQYLILPSFAPPVAWDVFRRGHQDEHLLIRTACRSDVDLEKLRTPVERLRHAYPLVPTVEVHQLNATSSDLVRLGAELAALEFPIGAPATACGTDGVMYEVAVEQPSLLMLSARCRLSWWHKPPTEWAGLAAWTQRAETVFESAWAARGDAAPTPLQNKGIDDAAARNEAQRLFHAGHYGRVAELLAEIGSRETLTCAEAKMLELALKRAGSRSGGGPGG